MNDIALDVTYIVKKYPYPYNLNLINALIYESRKINIDLLTLFNVGEIVKKVDLDTLDKIAREKIYLVDDYLKACKNLNIRYVVSKDGLIDLDFKKVIESKLTLDSELMLDNYKELFLALKEYRNRVGR
ncbi:MAG: hypothetical protein SO292_03625 [Bacilli bacterium]|nr:hypothetical protein [Bacilli bacterium]MDY4724296.1 hypothetical protein [Bacilli bacterium]MDY5248995.1 hypothetical protein [Bacilli bacterium]MDY5454956.1 hypothetical protein [Bacilli bacterium]